MSAAGMWQLEPEVMDRQKGGARTHSQQHHPIPQGDPFSKKFWPTTGSPQTMPIVQHSLVNTKRHTIMSMTFHHTPTTITLPAWVEQIHLCTINNLSHTDSFSWVLHLINWLIEGQGGVATVKGLAERASHQQGPQAKQKPDLRNQSN